MNTKIHAYLATLALDIKKRWHQFAAMAVQPSNDARYDHELCPRCRSNSFGQRGFILVCSACGWDSATSCGADGFAVSCSS